MYLLIVLLDDAAKPDGPATVLVPNATRTMFAGAYSDPRIRLWQTAMPAARGARIAVTRDVTER